MRGRKPKRSARLKRSPMKRGATPLKRRTPLPPGGGFKGPGKPLARRTGDDVGSDGQNPRRKRTMTPAALAAQKANAAKRVYVRKGRTLTCETCGREFYVRPGQVGRRRFCSAACRGFVSRAVRTCSVCGTKFQTAPRSGPRKTCGAACRNEAIRRAKLGGKNPNYHGAHRNPTDAWRAARKPMCEVRGCRSRRSLRQHHVVYEQHVRKRGGNPWDPRDSFTACFDHHNRHHHNADARIHVRDLTDENLRFARELLGEAAVDYFIRYYAGSRDEIEYRLARVLV